MLVASSEIFGAEHIGSIMGCGTFTMTLATSSGPLLGALVVDSEDKMRAMYMVCAGLAAVTGLCRQAARPSGECSCRS